MRSTVAAHRGRWLQSQPLAAAILLASSRSPSDTSIIACADRRERPGRRRAGEPAGDRCRPSGPVARAVVAKQREARRGIAERSDDPQDVTGCRRPSGQARCDRHGRLRSARAPAARLPEARSCHRRSAEARNSRRPARRRSGTRCPSCRRLRASVTAARPPAMAPFAARSERFTATSFQPTLAGGSLAEEMNAFGNAVVGDHQAVEELRHRRAIRALQAPSRSGADVR